MFGNRDNEESKSSNHESFDGLAVLREILTCVAIVVLSGGWLMLCLFILSFMFVSTGIFHVDWMIPVSIATGVIAGIIYIIYLIRLHSKK
ncbi:MAG: hypothetical protein K6F92_05275 [Lachnospiraceae bacterium]|nr:hypothetical protein [Lachnospiraceae bacterium]